MLDISLAHPQDSTLVDDIFVDDLWFRRDPFEARNKDGHVLIWSANVTWNVRCTLLWPTIPPILNILMVLSGRYVQKITQVSWVSEFLWKLLEQPLECRGFSSLFHLFPIPWPFDTPHCFIWWSRRKWIVCGEGLWVWARCGGDRRRRTVPWTRHTEDGRNPAPVGNGNYETL